MGETNQQQHFLKFAVWLDEMKLPFDEALAAAKKIGAEYVWFAELPGETDIAEMSDAEVDRMGTRVARHDLKLYQICAGHPFHYIRLMDLQPDSIQGHPAFRKDFNALIRGMQIAARLGVSAVLAYGLSWPGEWSQRGRTWGRSPTWPMRWATRGGIIAADDMDKLINIFSLVLEQAEKYNVDVVLGMRPFHYISTTVHFRLLVERLGSPRLKLQLSPGDSLLSAECDVATAGFTHVRPYLHGLHIKDVRVIDGPKGKYEWCPFGEGDVDYPTLIGRLLEHRSDVFLGVATHFRPSSESDVEAMEINFANVTSLISLLADQQRVD